MNDTVMGSNPYNAADAGPRRDFLYLAAGAFVAIGSGLSLWPFVHSMNPAADVLALATTEIDLSLIALGQRVTVQWRGQPVFIDHRTPEQIAAANADDKAALRDPEPDNKRAARPEWLIVVGICTHLGCIPLGQRTTDVRDEWGGWFCPCHGSHYDASGRIRKGPAPRNLAVPPYRFVNGNIARIG